jgi:hypothetical protein
VIYIPIMAPVRPFGVLLIACRGPRVYKAVCRATERTVVLKVFTKQEMTTKDVIHMTREVREGGKW